MMPYTTRLPIFERGGQRDVSVVLLIVGIVGVLALVWFVLKLGNDPTEASRLPEEGRLAGLMVVPQSGPWLGVTVESPEEPAAAGRPAGGVAIADVMVNSPAARAGLRSKDVIKQVNNTGVALPAQLAGAISVYRAGDTVQLLISRDNRDYAVPVTLGAIPTATTAAAVQPATSAWLGASVQNIDSLMAEKLALPEAKGVIVADVYQGSPAEVIGLRQGDLIKRVGEENIKDINQLVSIFADQRPGDTIDMLVWSRGTTRDISVTLANAPPPKAQPQPPLPEAEVEIEAAWLGLDIVPMSKAEAKELGLPANTRGMVVDDVAAGAGVDAGFQVGDVILAVNGKSAATIADFKEATESAVGAVVDVLRFGRHIYLSVPPPAAAQPKGKQAPPVRQVFFAP